MCCQRVLTSPPQVRSWVAQTLRSVSTTTTTLHPPRPPRWRVGGTSAVWSPAPERKIRGFTASPPGRMCPEWSRWSNRAAGWTTSTVTTGNWSLSRCRRVTGQTTCHLSQTFKPEQIVTHSLNLMVNSVSSESDMNMFYWFPIQYVCTQRVPSSSSYEIFAFKIRVFFFSACFLKADRYWHIFLYIKGAEH